MPAARTAAAPFGALTVWRFVSGIEDAWRGLVAAWRAEQTRRVLAHLTARERADLGLDDIDAWAAARR